MQNLVYEVSKDKRRLTVSNYEGEPYLMYRENECGLYLEVALKDEDINELKNNIELLHLPDDILLALGIDVSEEETLEELCEKLKRKGVDCEFKSYEDDACGYTEEIKVVLKGKRIVKVVVVEDEERGTRRVRVERAQKPYIYFAYNPPRRVLEVTVDADEVKEIENLRIEDILRKVLGEEVEPEDVVGLLEFLEDKYNEYDIQIERRGERIKWRLSIP